MIHLIETEQGTIKYDEVDGKSWMLDEDDDGNFEWVELKTREIKEEK